MKWLLQLGAGYCSAALRGALPEAAALGQMAYLPDHRRRLSRRRRPAVAKGLAEDELGGLKSALTDEEQVVSIAVDQGQLERVAVI